MVLSITVVFADVGERSTKKQRHAEINLLEIQSGRDGSLDIIGALSGSNKRIFPLNVLLSVCLFKEPQVISFSKLQVPFCSKVIVVVEYLVHKNN